MYKFFLVALIILAVFSPVVNPTHIAPMGVGIKKSGSMIVHNLFGGGSGNTKYSTSAHHFESLSDNASTNPYEELFDNTSVEYWNIFGGGDVIGIGEANTSRWGEVIVFFKTNGVTIVRVENISTNNTWKVELEYVYQKTISGEIVDYCIADVIGNDGFDDILIAYGRKVEEVITGESCSLQNENVEKIVEGNFDSDPEMELAVLTDFPYLYIYDHGLNQIYQSGKLWTGEYEPLDLFSGDIDDDNRDELVVVATNNTEESTMIVKLESNASIVFSNESSGVAYMPAILSLDSDGGPEGLVVVMELSGNYMLTYYNVTSSILTEITQQKLSRLPDCLMAFDLISGLGYEGDEVFVGIGENLTEYSSSGGYIKMYRFSEGNVSSVDGIIFSSSSSRGIICGLTSGDIVLLNDSLEYVSKSTVSSFTISFVIDFTTANFSYGIVVCDISNIGSIAHIEHTGSSYDIVKDIDFLVSGVVEYVDFLQQEETLLLCGDFPFILGLSPGGALKWGIRLNSKVARIDTSLVADAGYIALSTFGNETYIIDPRGGVIEMFTFGYYIYGLLVDDFDGDGDYEIFVGDAGGYGHIIDGGTIYNTSLWETITDACKVDFDGDEYLDIAVGLISNKVTIIEYDGSNINVLDSYNTQGIPVRSAWGDYNGDNALDCVLVVANLSAGDNTGAVSLYTIDKAFGFSQVDIDFSDVQWYNEPSNPEPRVILQDITGDGKDDVVMGLRDRNGGYARIYFIDLNDISKGVKYYDVPGDVYVFSVASVYANRGGINDIVCGLSNGQALVFLDDFFHETTIEPDKVLSLSGSVKSVRCADIDGDMFGEFFVGGTNGVSLRDEYHYLNITLLEPNITDGESYVGSSDVFMKWSAYCDLGIERYVVYRNGSPIAVIPGNMTEATISIEEGIWLINFTVKSNTVESLSGDLTLSKAIVFTLFVDLTPPELVIISAPERYTNTTRPEFRWNASDNISGLKAIRMYLNGTLYRVLPPNEKSFSFLVNSTCIYDVKIEAVDRANNTRAWSKTIIFDLTLPDIVIRSPGHVYYTNRINESITIGWTASDNFGLEKIIVLTPSSAVELDPNTTLFSVRFDREGIYDVAIIAVDYAGNRNNDSVRIIMDTTPPVLEILEPDNLSAYGPSSTQVCILYNAYDELSNISHVDVFLDEINVTRIESISISMVVIDLALYNKTIEGEHTITVICADNVGNIASVVIKILYDETPPTVRILAPQQGKVETGEVTIKWEATDSISGIEYVEVWIDEKLLDKYYDASGEVTVGIPEGEHTITIIACDKAGNYGKAEVKIEVSIKAINKIVGIAIFIAVVAVAAVATFLIFRHIKRKRARLEELS